ncbi:type III restriction enzyme, res subunit domain-containing protein [Trichoderma breve]|uniref:ATP-dependent DNA helicase n=1 Tax=Trichoderma breve TaxID=2034170 RepID=A0A9W9BA19_9HYPO|nr:type III restriction enzyme, res subunit domain-containing protein [Trichoderma breve]KAJ4858719.1 type III restriction enzyme, res subunit domain-containing protein [Trichoderma breve]
MDSDDFDDDIADEDILAAFDQESSSNGGKLVSTSSSSGSKNSAGDLNKQQWAAQELNDLPSDAFSSPEPVRQIARGPAKPVPTARNGFSRTNSGTLRQTTLWGGHAATEDAPRPSQTTTTRVYRADLPPEPPSPHQLDREALKTWVLFNNTLVALPTGLGKTFIAATVMLNFYRWTKTAKIVFVAPTKPLVTQQIDACYNIAGIPRSETTLLTGDIAPALRSDEWEKRRVFFMTPQTLLNDLSHGYADPKSIGLMVIDEAHRAVGEYAYAKATKLIRRFSNSFRVLALTATPGSKVETVQEVIDNLGISHCEIRTEESLDIRQYVHDRNIDQIVLDPSDEMNLIGELFTEALKPLTEKLSSQNIWYGRNPMALTTYGLIQAQKEWFATRGNRANQGVQFMMRAIFSVLTSLAHSIKLLQYHGIKPFYDNMVDFRSEQEDKGEKGSKYRRQIIDSASFQEMMDKIAGWLKLDGFVGHPKLTALADCVLNHFMDNGEGTRVIVFSEYRDSAEEIVRMFNTHRPLIKATVFVGQADGKRGEGMKQKQQIDTIEKFKTGAYNVLVATSIGEEGLDIGQVDLIVCYDSSASPIRMLQRMGRTGRKRAGNIALLLMRGKEEEQFAKSKDNYEKMQKLICEGSRFNFRFDLSTRIVPRDIRPEVDMRHVEIPVENTQDKSLPEPKKRQVPKGKKKPPKKFHMPDGVQTGFQKVSDFMKVSINPGERVSKSSSKPKRNPELDDLTAIPELDRVVLGSDELYELERTYRNLPFNRNVTDEADLPSMEAHPKLQRQLRPTAFVPHGAYTKRCVKLLQKLGDADSLVRPRSDVDTSDYLEIPVKPFVYSDNVESDDDSLPKKNPQSAARHIEEEEEEPGLPPRLSEAKRQKRLNSKSKGKTSRKAAIGSDEIGDDCERDSDLLDESDSDDGADLVDFVVGDDQATSSMFDSEATSPIKPNERTPRAGASKPYFVPTQFTATQESDGVPDLHALAGPSRMQGRAREASEEAAPTNRRRRTRPALLDSDDSDV